MNPSRGGSTSVVRATSFTGCCSEEYERSERTFVISTHIIEEAASVFEKVLFLDHGSAFARGGHRHAFVALRVLKPAAKRTCGAAAEGRPVLHREQMGAQRDAVRRARPTRPLSQRCRALDVACDPVPLQKLFVYLAGQKEA